MHRFMRLTLICVIITSRAVLTTEQKFTAGFCFHSGFVIGSEEAYKELTARSGCRCRGLCLNDQECESYSWSPRGDAVLCRLTKLKNDELTRLPNPNGITAFNQNQYLFKGPDGLLYYHHSELMNFDDAMKFCRTLGRRFEIGMYKTPEEFQVILDIYAKDSSAQIWVNLVPKAVDDIPASVWADGQPFYETQLGKSGLVSLMVNGVEGEMHRFRDGTWFDDKSATQQLTVLCQNRKM